MHLFIALIIFVVIIVVLRAYFKYSKVYVGTLFVVYYKNLMRQGWRAEDAIKAAIDNFRYRKPFSLLSDNDLANVMNTLKNLNNPPEVGASLLQKIEVANKDVARINDSDALYDWAIREDIKITIFNIIEIETAKEIKVPNTRKFNIAEKVIILLMKRVGWKRFPDTQDDSFVFDYHGKRIMFNKQNNAVNIIKALIDAELREKFELNLSPYNFVGNYEKLFNGAWQEFSDKKGRIV